MPSVRSKLSPSLTESAIAETVRRVNAQALALLRRRVEINRRIRALHRVVRGLRDLAINTTGEPRKSAFTGPEGATWTSHLEQTRKNPGAYDGNSSLGHAVGGTRSRPPGESQHELVVLSRACRIALMETGSLVSPDEICLRIERRGSFAFLDSKSANAAVARTLNIMKGRGEVRCVTRGCQSLWQRITPAAEIDNSQ